MTQHEETRNFCMCHSNTTNFSTDLSAIFWMRGNSIPIDFDMQGKNLQWNLSVLQTKGPLFCVNGPAVLSTKVFNWSPITTSTCCHYRCSGGRYWISGLIFDSLCKAVDKFDLFLYRMTCSKFAYTKILIFKRRPSHSIQVMVILYNITAAHYVHDLGNICTFLWWQLL